MRTHVRRRSGNGGKEISHQKKEKEEKSNDRKLNRADTLASRPENRFGVVFDFSGGKRRKLPSQAWWTALNN